MKFFIQTKDKHYGYFEGIGKNDAILSFYRSLGYGVDDVQLVQGKFKIKGLSEFENENFGCCAVDDGIVYPCILDLMVYNENFEEDEDEDSF